MQKITLALLLTSLLGGCSNSPDIDKHPSNTPNTSAKSCADSSLLPYETDQYGGWLAMPTTPTGRFRVEEINDVWWLISPEGHAMWSNGTTGIRIEAIGADGEDGHREAILATHGSEEAWYDFMAHERLPEIGVNTHGGWTSGTEEQWDGQLAYPINLEFYPTAPEVPGWPAGFLNKKLRDYFTSDWPAQARAYAESNASLQRCISNPWCIGAFISNEQPRGPSLNSVGTHLDAYMSMEANAPGKLALQQFFEDRYVNDLAQFNTNWSQNLSTWDDLQQLDRLHDYNYTDPITDEGYHQFQNAERRSDRVNFEAYVAQRFAQVVHDVLRAMDPDMLILGERAFSIYLSPHVVEATAPYFDVYSVNNYPYEADGRATLVESAGSEQFGYLFRHNPYDDLRIINNITDKPILITEWFWRVPRPESGASGTQPGLSPPLYPTTSDYASQANNYSLYQQIMMAHPAVIGSSWFQWNDQPASGRNNVAQDNPLTPENQLIGVVNRNDEYNQPLASTMADVNKTKMYALRCGAIDAPEDNRPETAATDNGLTAFQVLRDLFALFNP